MQNSDNKAIRLIVLGAFALILGLVGLAHCDTSVKKASNTLSKDGVEVYQTPRPQPKLEILFKSSRTYEKESKKDKGCKNVNVIVTDSQDSVWIDYNGLTIVYTKVSQNPKNPGQIYVVDSANKPYLLTLATISEKEGDPNPRIWLFIETKEELTVLSQLEECEQLKLKLN